MRQVTAGGGKKVSLEMQSLYPIIVFEEADVDSAVEAIVDAAFIHSGKVR